MFDTKELQFILKVMDNATVKGLEANQMMVGIASKFAALQTQLNEAALTALKTPTKRPTKLVAIETPEADQVSEDEPSKEMVPE